MRPDKGTDVCCHEPLLNGCAPEARSDRLDAAGRGLARRGLLLGLGTVMLLAAPGQPSAALPDERSLRLQHLCTGEALEVTYVADGRYRPEALAAVARLLRDWRTGDTHPVAPDLLDLLWAVRERLGSAAPLGVTCGYRTPETNALLASEHYPASRASLHVRGMAVDLRVADREPSAVRDAALGLGAGRGRLLPAAGRRAPRHRSGPPLAGRVAPGPAPRLSGAGGGRRPGRPGGTR